MENVRPAKHSTVSITLRIKPFLPAFGRGFAATQAEASRNGHFSYVYLHCEPGTHTAPLRTSTCPGWVRPVQGFRAGEVKQGAGPLACNNGSEPRAGGAALSFFSLEARMWAAGGLSLPH